MAKKKHECSLECSRRAVAERGPYRVISCANDTYRIERVSVHCKRHHAKRLDDCEDCAMAGAGLLSRMRLAEDIAAVLNARRSPSDR